MARTYPALDLRWPSDPVTDVVDRALAEIDAASPLAVEECPDGVRVFFPSVAKRDQAAALLTRAGPPPACTSIEVPDEDWAARSQAALDSVTIDRIVVAPPWARPALQPGQIKVIVLPSMGFGTGHHASTRLCLRLLQREPAGGGTRVVDVGTGSGVLALAAAKLGVRRTVGIDSDPDALEAATENVKLNGLENAVELGALDLAAASERLPDRFDIVLANLTGAVLIRNARSLAAMTDPAGCLIVGGVERHEADAVRAALRGAGLREADRLDEDGWVGMTFRTNPTRSTER